MEVQEVAKPKRKRGPRVNFPRQQADVSHGRCESPFFTVEQFCRRNPAWTPASFRWKIFHASENGLEASGAIIRDGRQIFIDEAKYFDWFRGKAEAA